MIDTKQLVLDITDDTLLSLKLQKKLLLETIENVKYLTDYLEEIETNDGQLENSSDLSKLSVLRNEVLTHQKSIESVSSSLNQLSYDVKKIQIKDY